MFAIHIRIDTTEYCSTLYKLLEVFKSYCTVFQYALKLLEITGIVVT